MAQKLSWLSVEGSQSLMSNLQNKLEGDKSIYNSSDTMCKSNLVIEQLPSQQLSIVHAKSLIKETEYGAEH